MDRLRERHEVTAELIASFLLGAPALDESRRELGTQGVSAWIAGDQIKAVHALISQIEVALGQLLGLLGRPTNKRVRSNISVMLEKSLDDCLQIPLLVTLGETFGERLLSFGDLSILRGVNHAGAAA